jgi:DNA processing protein
LLQISDHPILLYVKGKLICHDPKTIAIVGTRQATIYGLEMGEKFSRDLACRGFVVISGLARGVDTAAHQGALQSGNTYAVIGSGLANVYPRENIQLSEKIAEKGALISEFSMTTPPDRSNFPRRNRIVSALALGTILIEAPLKSGAMLTMNIGENQGKKLFCLPGRVDHENFQGNHMLIKSGRAQLIENADDVIKSFSDLFGNSSENFSCHPESRQFLLGPEEKDFFDRFPTHEVSLDQLLELSSMPIAKLNFLLMSLLLKGAIKEFPGKIYKKK